MGQGTEDVERALSEADWNTVQSVLARWADHHRWQVRRDALACALGAKGLRIQETCNLILEDLLVSEGKLRVRTLKGGKLRFIPLDEWLLKRLIQLGKEADARGSKWLFGTRAGTQLDTRNLRRRWSAFTGGKLEAAHRYHDLRHTAAIFVHEATGDVGAVQRILGHRKIETTSLYLTKTKKLNDALPSIGASHGQEATPQRRPVRTQGNEVRAREVARDHVGGDRRKSEASGEAGRRGQASSGMARSSGKTGTGKPNPQTRGRGANTGMKDHPNTTRAKSLKPKRPKQTQRAARPQKPNSTESRNRTR